MSSFPITILSLGPRPFDRDYNFPEHIQPLHQWYAVLDGIVDYRVESTERRLGAGDAVFVAAGLRRTPRAGSKRGLAVIVLFSSPWPELGRPDGHPVHLDAESLAEARALVHEGSRAVGPTAHILFNRLCLRVLGTQWFHRLGRGKEAREAQAQASGAQLVEQIESIMISNINVPLRLHDFAHMSGVSPAHLRRLFQAHRQTAPTLRFRQLRLERAHILLQSRERSVTDVAHDLCFSSSQHLAQAFKDAFGYPPTAAWRHPKHERILYTG